MTRRLRGVRTRPFLTQEELAQRTGVTKAMLSRRENGLPAEALPPVRKLAAARASAAARLAWSPSTPFSTTPFGPHTSP